MIPQSSFSQTPAPIPLPPTKLKETIKIAFKSTQGKAGRIEGENRGTGLLSYTLQRTLHPHPYPDPLNRPTETFASQPSPPLPVAAGRGCCGELGVKQGNGGACRSVALREGYAWQAAAPPFKKRRPSEESRRLCWIACERDRLIRFSLHRNRPGISEGLSPPNIPTAASSYSWKRQIQRR